MANEVDIVRDIIDRLVREVPEITVECAYRIEREVRDQWGGGHVYVPRDPARHAKQHAAVQAWRNGCTISEVSLGFGVDRKTIYRLISKRK